ncbi:hypothetical protein KC973_02720 [Candidatus Saccharibacteria bacterium]|nr:hypothetical protein [Candidatus Saccharibacteria bacterium]
MAEQDSGQGNEAYHDVQSDVQSQIGPERQDGVVKSSSHNTSIGTRYSENTTTSYHDMEVAHTISPDPEAPEPQSGYSEDTKLFTTQTEFANRPGETMQSIVKIDNETGDVVHASRTRTVKNPQTGETETRTIPVNAARMGKAALRLSKIYAKERAEQETQKAA